MPLFSPSRCDCHRANNNNFPYSGLRYRWSTCLCFQDIFHDVLCISRYRNGVCTNQCSAAKAHWLAKASVSGIRFDVGIYIRSIRPSWRHSSVRHYGYFILRHCHEPLHSLQLVNCNANHNATDNENAVIYRWNVCIRLPGLGHFFVQSSMRMGTCHLGHHFMFDWAGM